MFTILVIYSARCVTISFTNAVGMRSSIQVALDDSLMILVTSLTLAGVIVSMGAIQVLRMESKSGIDILAVVDSKDIRTSLSVSIFDMKKVFKFLAKRRFDEAVGRMLGFSMSHEVINDLV